MATLAAIATILSSVIMVALVWGVKYLRNKVLDLESKSVEQAKTIKSLQEQDKVVISALKDLKSEYDRFKKEIEKRSKRP